MEAQQDDTPWPSSKFPENPDALLGRGSFDQLGQVRRKPGRPHKNNLSPTQLKAIKARADSPISLSKSCSDKIALKQCTSILSGVASLLLSPANAYIDTLILPSSQYRSEACQRAFGSSGRLQSLNGRQWSGGYTFCPFDVDTTEFEFVHSRRRGDSCQLRAKIGHDISLKGSNVTAVWSARSLLLESADLNGVSKAEGSLIQNSSEVLIKGRLQGWKAADPRGASRVSRKKTWQAVAEVLSALSSTAPVASTYEDLKLSGALAERRTVKAEATADALKGWIPNIMDDFALR